MSAPIAILAEFKDPAALISAAKKTREAGYQKFDCHSPFPIHGMDQAMGMKRSPLGYMVFAVAIVAFLATFGFESWTHAVDYKIVVAGKPFFSYQAFGTVAFALMVLLSAVTALFGMLTLNKLPMFYHPLFASDKLGKTTDDGFFVIVESADPKFDLTATEKFLKDIGGTNIEVIKEES